VEIQDFSLDFFSLKGKTAIVTGGNTGLGRTFSLALAKSGASLYIPSIIDDGGVTLDLLHTECPETEVEVIHTDLAEEGSAERVVRGCIDRFGSLDILVNSAGLNINKPVEEFERCHWDRMVRINLTAPFELIHEAMKVMIPRNSGKIINVCSLFSFLGGQLSPAYAATKHGLAGLTKAFCDELAQYNIQVNGIAPGYFATDLTANTRSNPVANARVIQHVPAGGWGNSLDLMGTIVYLASRASDFVNGHILTVDGGYLVR